MEIWGIVQEIWKDIWYKVFQVLRFLPKVLVLLWGALSLTFVTN